MKKALLLSVVASSMIMAGGDIAPVEPVVETPAPAASGWEFSGTGVVYYQTSDAIPGTVALLSGGSIDDSLFAQDTSFADAGIQLRATNNDVVAGIGAGVEVSGLATLNLENWMVSDVMQSTGNGAGVLGGTNDVDDVTDGGWISQAYLTYGFGNTSIKAGRQELPKALSPFAFSEDWNVFKNTFDAVLVVNSDLPDTTLVGAWVAGANYNSMGVLSPVGHLNNITDFNSLNDERGVWMLTAQNKSIANLTLTGSYYFANEFITDDNLNILWGDAQYDASSFNVGVQGGTVMHDAFDAYGDDIVAFGAKVGAELAGAHLMAAYANVNDGGAPGVMGMFNIGGTTSALYTDLLSDQLANGPLTGYTRFDMDKFVVKGHMDALGGTIAAAYGYTDMNAFDGDLNEFNLGYSVNVTDGLGLNVAYAYLSADIEELDDDANVVRVVATYNF